MASLAVTALTAATTLGPTISTLSTVLQGAATVGSVLQGQQAAQEQLRAGHEKAADLELQAKLELARSEQETLASEARAVELRREALRKIGSARVAFGASGLSASSGQLAGIEGEIGNDAEFGLSIEASNRAINQNTSGLRRGQLRKQGRNAIRASSSQASATRSGALLTGAQNLLSIVKRG